MEDHQLHRISAEPDGRLSGGLAPNPHGQYPDLPALLRFASDPTGKLCSDAPVQRMTLTERQTWQASSPPNNAPPSTGTVTS